MATASSRREASLIAAIPGVTLGSGRSGLPAKRINRESIMSDTHLLRMALGLTPPWTVTGADFDPEARRLDIHIDFPSGSRFACPECGATGCPPHDTAPMTPRP